MNNESESQPDIPPPEDFHAMLMLRLFAGAHLSEIKTLLYRDEQDDSELS